MDRSGVEQAAILLLALGEQEAAQVLKHLGAKDVQRVGTAMAQLSGISREEVSSVLTNFSTNVEQQTSFGVGTDGVERDSEGPQQDQPRRKRRRTHTEHGQADRSAVEAGLALNPSFTVSRARINWTAMSDDPVHPIQLAPIFEGLRAAGLAEE